MPYELIIEAVLALLMIAVIASAWVLNQKLTIIRQGQEEMADLVAKLDQVSNDAQASLVELKTKGTEAEEQLRHHTQKARALADELSVITEAGNSLADRLDKGLSQRNASEKETAQTKEKSVKKVTRGDDVVKGDEEPKTEDEILEDAERAVLKALQGAR